MSWKASKTLEPDLWRQWLKSPSANPGETPTLHLPDGSSLFLSEDSREIYLTGEITAATGTTLTAMLRHVNSLGARWDAYPPIVLYINSGGGETRAGFAIIDCMNAIDSPVITYIQGEACSMAALISMAGARGGRIISPNSVVMLHQPSGGIIGKHDEIKDWAVSMETEVQLAVDHITRCTGQRKPTVRKDLKRDLWLTAKEALEYGRHGIADIINPE